MVVFYARYLSSTKIISLFLITRLRKKGVLLSILILKAVLLRNLSAPTLWSCDVQLHSVVSDVAFNTAVKKSTESAKEVGVVHAQLAEVAPSLTELRSLLQRD